MRVILLAIDSGDVVDVEKGKKSFIGGEAADAGDRVEGQGVKNCCEIVIL